MGRNILLTLIGLAFVAIGVFLLATGREPWTSPDAWGGLLFFGGCTLVGLIDTVQSVWPPKPVASETALVLHYNRSRVGVLGVAAAMWAAVGVLGLYGTMFPIWLAWVLVAFGGFCAAVALPLAFDGRAKVVVDAEGIADYRVLTRKIPWADVRSAAYSGATGMATVGVTLTAPEAYAGLRTTIGRLFGRKIDPVHINDAQLDGSLHDITEAIWRFAPEALHTQQTRIGYGHDGYSDEDEDED